MSFVALRYDERGRSVCKRRGISKCHLQRSLSWVLPIEPAGNILIHSNGAWSFVGAWTGILLLSK